MDRDLNRSFTGCFTSLFILSMGTKMNKTSFLEEREKFLASLLAARNTKNDASALINQLISLQQEIQLNRGETRSLRRKLDQTAIEFGLQPIPGRSPKQ